MLSTDRSEFADHLGTLCAGFNVPLTDLRSEAYWRDLAKMQLGQFARVVEHALGPDGPERIPTAPQCWSIARSLRARPSAPTVTPPERVFDPFVTFGNRCLLQFLRTHGGVDEAALPHLVAEKNRLAGQFREVAAECDVSAEEVREAMRGAFDRIAGRPAAAEAGSWTG